MSTQEAPAFGDFEEDISEVPCWGKLQPLDTNKYETLYMTDEAKVYKIGRDGDLKISIDIVSGAHCNVRKKGSLVFLEDTSTNGTFLRGQMLGKGKSVPITSGTKICLVRSNPKNKIGKSCYVALLLKDALLLFGI